MVLKGKPVVDSLLMDLSGKIEQLKNEKGIVPTLAIVRVGEREDDIAYERGAEKRFTSNGAAVIKKTLPSDCSGQELRAVLENLNADPGVHGILMFRPLPKHLNEDEYKNVISPQKDVDCYTYRNTAGVFAGEKGAFPPCTPQAVMELLKYYEIDLKGKKAVILGRSMVVGKPLAMLMLKENATVTVCHTKTVDIEKECSRADILVACAGVARLVKESYTNPNQIVIDVGINVVDGVMCGDVDYHGVEAKVQGITPVPGGIGAVTSTVLLKHTVESAIMS